MAMTMDANMELSSSESLGELLNGDIFIDEYATGRQHPPASPSPLALTLFSSASPWWNGQDAMLGQPAATAICFDPVWPSPSSSCSSLESTPSEMGWPPATPPAVLPFRFNAFPTDDEQRRGMASTATDGCTGINPATINSALCPSDSPCPLEVARQERPRETIACLSPPTTSNGRTVKACLHCRARKAKCTGGERCAECQRRGGECHYPAEIRRRGKGKAPKKARTANRGKCHPANGPNDDLNRPEIRARTKGMD